MSFVPGLPKKVLDFGTVHCAGCELTCADIKILDLGLGDVTFFGGLKWLYAQCKGMKDLNLPQLHG